MNYGTFKFSMMDDCVTARGLTSKYWNGINEDNNVKRM